MRNIIKVQINVEAAAANNDSNSNKDRSAVNISTPLEIVYHFLK